MLVEKISSDELPEEPVEFNGTVYILRGLPGSGKSSIALALIDSSYSKEYGEYRDAIICCADDYHMVDDKYMWSPEKVGYAHKMCREKFALGLTDKVSTIIVANTNTMASEMQFYRDEAKKANYFVQIITVGEFSDEAVERYYKQNTHNVPLESIKKMRDRFKLV